MVLLIEASEIFQQIQNESRTSTQVITETNYIIDELKDYRDIYCESLQKCPKCAGDIIKAKDKYKCESCDYIVK